MAKKTIRAGKTDLVNGALNPDDILTIQGGPSGGGAGGLGIVSISLTNAGTINVLGGAPSTQAGVASGLGGTLNVQGVLTDSGAIELHAGRMATGAVLEGQGALATLSGTLSITAAGSVTVDGGTGNTASAPPSGGGTLTSTGTITNAGLLMLAGGHGDTAFTSFHNSYGGLGGALNSAGALTNSGSIVVQGGQVGAYGKPGGMGAILDDTGVLTNTGTLSVTGGSPGTYESVGGLGGTLSVEGVLTNAGTLQLGGGIGSRGSYSGGGYGATLLNSGTLTNTGLIEVRAGGSEHFNSGGQGAEIIDSGTLSSTGTIRLGGAPSASAYDRASAGGTIVVSGVLTNDGSLTILGGTGAAETGYDGFPGDPGLGGLLLDQNFVNTMGVLTIGGGQAGGAYGIGGLGGDLALSDNTFAQVSNTGTIIVQGGEGASFVGYRGHSTAGSGGTIEVGVTTYLYDSNTLDLQGGTGGIAGGGGGASLMLNGNLVESGTLTVGAGIGGANATFTIGATGTLELLGRLENDGLLQLNGGRIDFEGTVRNANEITGSGTLVSTTLLNDGIVDVGSGTLQLEENSVTSDTGSGVFQIGAGGVLSFYGVSIDATQSIDMLAAGASLNTTANSAGDGVGVLIVSPFGGTVNIFQVGGYSSVGTLNAADTNLIIKLDTATNLTLSRMSAISAIGSSGSDTITALSSGQTLTGGAGVDLLTGAAATGDLFQDVAAGLNGDTIKDFAGTDAIDITDLVSGTGLMLAYTQHGATGSLAVSEGSTTTTITLQGHFTTSSFSTASDNHGGVQITLHG